MPEFKFQGKAERGSLKFNDKESFVTFLQSMEGKNFTLTLKEVKQVRSLGWNSYYWTVVVPRVKVGLVDVGYDPDELDNEVVHEFLKKRFLTKEIYSGYTDEMITITERTSKIPNDAFKAYCERIQRWATEYLHIYIPDPNEGRGIGKQD